MTNSSDPNSTAKQNQLSFEIREGSLLAKILSPRLFLMLVGFILFLGFWHLAVEVWRLPRFAQMPALRTVVTEILSPNPTYGISIFVGEYADAFIMSDRNAAANMHHRSGRLFSINGKLFFWSKPRRVKCDWWLDNKRHFAGRAHWY